jgi:hypothetical protein
MKRSLSAKTAVMISIIIALVYVTFARTPAHSAAAQPTKFQYLVVEAPKNREKQQAVLDKYGAEGWHLVTMEIWAQHTFVFERTIE